MLDKVKSGTAARIAIPRSGAALSAAADAARAHEVAPVVEGHGVYDDGPRRDPHERSDRDEARRPASEPGAAAKRAIDDALKSLLGGPGGPGRGYDPRDRNAATVPDAAPRHTLVSLRHGRAADAYGLQADLREPKSALRPGTVFSARF